MANNKDKEFFVEFDDVTLTKLNIYEHYLQLWLPVPLSGRMGKREAVVYDLFCGPGQDSKGVKGSPLRGKDVIYKNQKTISNSNVAVRLVFNDHDEDHVTALNQTLGDRLKTDGGEVLATISYHSEEFDTLFPRLIEGMANTAANLLFIDQFGATGIDEQRFKELHALKSTDILFFISSNWFWRFVGQPEAADWGITRDDLSKIEYSHVHRFLTDHFRALVGAEYYVAPFSLKKGSNIYGLVFASHNPLGLEKFLTVGWQQDPRTGEANYDIDNEGADPNQLSMFEARKVTEYQQDLRARIEEKQFGTDQEIYLYMLESGFLNKHTKSVVMEYASVKAGFLEFHDATGKRMPCRVSKETMKEPRKIVYLKD